MKKGNDLRFIEIEMQSTVPAYLQIMLQIQSLILRDDLCAGDQLPTVRQLAAQLAINFNTVARAYRMLDRAGLITTQQGRGTYVLNSKDAHQMLREEVLHELTVRYLAETCRLEFSTEEVERAFRSQVENLNEN